MPQYSYRSASKVKRLSTRFMCKVPLICGITLVTACATVYDPDRGRVFTPGSLASVGPLLDASVAPAPDVSIPSASPDATESEASSSQKVVSKSEPQKQSDVSLSAQTKNTSGGKEPKQQALAPARQPTSQHKHHKKASKDIATPAPVHAHGQVSQAKVETSEPMMHGVLRGKVALVGTQGETLSPAGVIIRLSPKGAVAKTKVTEGKVHTIDMRDKTYMPRHIVVGKNDQVSFINQDKIKHNVFSSSGENAFDLGTYGAGKQRQVKLNAEGIVKVYCNIHPEMATFISVAENSLSAVANEQGEFSISHVPAGLYTMNIWHIRGETSEEVSVSAGESSYVDTVLDTGSYQKAERKNKFGKKYSNNTALFDDEFY